MKAKAIRKPVGNFFIKRSLQIRLIQKIVFSAVVSTVISSSTLFLVYYLRYKTIVVYQLDKISQELSRENLLIIILPALLISALVSIVLAFCIGLYSSRKYAVPIYKLEQWVSLLLHGKVSATLRFREKDEMRELTDKCNSLGADLQNTLIAISKKVELLKQENSSPQIVRELETILAKFDFETIPIEVNTTFYQISTDSEKTSVSK
jgi:methyl-accepting chemotaxis protein